jgi:hypothetical protein
MTLIRRIKVSYFLFVFSLLSSLGATTSIRQFDRDAMRAYADDPQFAYMSFKMQPPSIWDRLLWYLIDLWNEFWNNPITSRLTLWLFILTMLGIAIFFILRMKFRGVLENSNNAVIRNSSVAIDDERLDYDSLIGQSLEQNDFKNAIRWLYLKGLSKLSQKEKIRLATWKTPFDYQMELKGNSVDPYARLSLLFEYVWYGDFEVKRSDFDKGRNYLERLEESIE